MLKKLYATTILSIMSSLSVAAQEGSIQDLNSETAKSVIVDSQKPIVIFVYSQCSEACQRMKSHFEDFAKNTQADYTCARINADQEKNFMSEYNVKGLPSIIVFNNKELVIKMCGFCDGDTLSKKIADSL